eukprot:15046.XXX_671822_671586_1 [CDS] Oithona nana genome sequencing.
MIRRISSAEFTPSGEVDILKLFGWPMSLRTSPLELVKLLYALLLLCGSSIARFWHLCYDEDSSFPKAHTTKRFFF